LSANLGSESWFDPHGVEHVGPVLERIVGVTVVDCCVCGFAHVLPLPTPDELARFYISEFYSEAKPIYIERNLEDKEWWDGVYTERFDSLEKILPENQRRLLDVGSGPGLFLDHGRRRGWSVKGLEPSSKAARFSRDVLKLDVEELFLTPENAGGLGTYDVVNLGEVLEHLVDPAAILNTAHGLLVEGGILLLIVPNDFNALQLILRRGLKLDPWWVGVQHLNYFSPNSLNTLVERNGFEVISLETSFPLEFFQMMGLNYIGDDVVGRRIHGYRMELEKTFWNSGSVELKRKIYGALSGIGLGREIILFARKVAR